MNKEKYYVSIASSEISQVKVGNNASFTIYATSDEVRSLRGKMDNMHDADMGAFWRSHIPIMPYHNDQSNDDYDVGITAALQEIYELGNDEAKSHIREMGILTDRHM